MLEVNTYRVDLKNMANAKKDMIVLHPLPRVDDIRSRRACYSSSALLPAGGKWGVVIRMGLLSPTVRCGKVFKVA